MGRALNNLLTMWPELSSRRQRLDVVLSLLLVLPLLQKVFLQPLGFCPILTFNYLIIY